MPTSIAVITDVHANLPALAAALGAIEEERVEAIYHTGDVIGFGPYPAETLDRLLRTPRVHLLMGNHDELFVRGNLERSRSPGEAAHHRWTHAQIDPSLRAVVADWPHAIEERWHGLPVTFTHYGRKDDGSGFAEAVPAPVALDLDSLFTGAAGDLVFYGHNHLFSDEQGRARYVNPGALGCGSEAQARYVVLEIADDGNYTLQHRFVPYDPTALIQEFAKRDVPERDFILGTIFRQRAAS